MCGLFGITHPNIPRARKALQSLSHRGPDQSGDWHDAGLYIGHRRLSILDLSVNGKQPMLASKTGVLSTVNGEIYNFRELRKELQEKHVFYSQSDSEVVLNGYLEWGLDKLLDRIDGMYAFSIYDPRVNKVHLARDIAGIKPLYYYFDGKQFGWASELKAIVNYLGESQLTLDQSALYDFLTYLYIPPPKSMYQNIFKLEAAHTLSIDLNSKVMKKKRYWSLPTAVVDTDEVSAQKQLKLLVSQSIEEQLISDVPLGFFLSGGIDSSVIVSCAAQQSQNINTYTIGFDVPGYDESEFAQSVAAMHATRHCSKIMRRQRCIDLYSRLNQWFDEPHADTSALPTFMVSELAKKDVSVVLTGDGGDEIFGGYIHYFKFKKITASRYTNLSGLKSINAWLKQKFQSKEIGKLFSNIERRYFLTDLELHCRLLGGMLKNEKNKYRLKFGISDDYDDYWFFRQYYREELPIITRLQYLDFHTYLPEDILTKVDRTSMAVSLEARVPFISKKIIEFSFSLPESIRIPNHEPKGILTQSFATQLPKQILGRKKKGFTIPIKPWRTDFFGQYRFPQEQTLNELFLAGTSSNLG